MEDVSHQKGMKLDTFPTPDEIVSRLDNYIIGQSEAKKAVAIALRNRWRRQRVIGQIKDEIYPNNIILIGPTGVGKTEIARRLAGLAHAPFIKVEASRFTEVGYVGRDVESMVRDLIEISVNMIRQEKNKLVEEKAKQFAEERILDILLPMPSKLNRENKAAPVSGLDKTTRDKMRARLRQGALDERIVELQVSRASIPFVEVFSQAGVEELSVALEDAFGGKLPKRKKKRKMPIKEALRYLQNEEAEKLIDMDEVVNEARKRTEQSGIIFVDEIDKIA
ncbi:hypothetical protein AMJ52_04140, partial [candidate division TA06 bacterium DG_78]